MKFKEYLKLREGGMVADDKAEEGKSKPKHRPSTGGAKMQQDNSGTAGGPGKGSSTGAGASGPPGSPNQVNF